MNGLDHRSVFGNGNGVFGHPILDQHVPSP
jgi:hypothetical protein